MIELINSDIFKWFRKSFLNKIYNKIYNDKEHYCCHVTTWHKLFICWKDLKEVKENMKSIHLADDIRDNENLQHCTVNWFYWKRDRISFLKECLDKFKTS